jgi:hypothetical protein
MPWLPWPLSAWAWWTEPLRAERLALLRIGVALCLIVDIALNDAPFTFSYFGIGGLGDPALFNWRFQPDRMTWSLLRGVGDGPIVIISLALWLATTGWILATSTARLFLIRNEPPPNDRTGIALTLWVCALLVYTVGHWSRIMAKGDAANVDILAWGIPLAGFSLACLFHVLDLLTSLRDPGHHVPRLALLSSLLISLGLTVGGIALALADAIDKTAWWVRLLRSWQQDDMLLVTAMCMWIGSAILLLVGCATRLAAVSTWVISMSFASANSYVENAGDTIRLILLFYLMFCPCGAVWSVDVWFKRAGPLSREDRPHVPSEGAGPVYVHPWPIRLIFIQMILIYFMNGLYKLLGPTWQDGTAVHYVLGELTLTRFSQVALPLPIELTRALTWLVVTWELAFPLMVLWKWPRRVALTFGVLFHLGIFATMELAGFVPYALCMYLPLIPWERRSDSLARPDDARIAG